MTKPISKATTLIPKTVFLHFKQKTKIGVYTLSSFLLIGFLFSGRSLPFNKKLISTGVSVMAKKASTIRMNDFVQAKGLNNFPSIPVSKKTGRKDAITISVE
jgi:hypothetical protein